MFSREKRSAESFYSNARRCTPSLWCASSLQGSRGAGGKATTEVVAATEAEGEEDEAPLFPERHLLTAKEKKVLLLLLFFYQHSLSLLTGGVLVTITICRSNAMEKDSTIRFFNVTPGTKMW
jgi:hypothetical protein